MATPSKKKTGKKTGSNKLKCCRYCQDYKYCEEKHECCEYCDHFFNGKCTYKEDKKRALGNIEWQIDDYRGDEYGIDDDSAYESGD